MSVSTEPRKSTYDWRQSLVELFDPSEGMPGADPFVCDREQCDGKPHIGDTQFQYKHARAPQQAQFFKLKDWFVAVFRAGRGTGKTRTGAEWLVEQMLDGGMNTFWAIVTPTFDDGRDIAIGGESGILFVLERRNIRYHYNKSLGILDLLDNQARLELYADTNPERLRGPNLSGAWVDEPASMKNALGVGSEPGTWDNLLLMCRIGKPQILVTGTPKNTKFVKKLLKMARLVVGGNPMENRDNLADVWFEEVIEPLMGTSLGRQEVDGQVLEAVDGALWKQEWIITCQIDEHGQPILPRFRTIRIGWDPAITSHAKSDEHGIVVAGTSLDGVPWVLDDLSGIMSPLDAAKTVLQAAIKWGVSLVAIEPNQGGDTWETLLKLAATALEIDVSKVPSCKKVTSTTSKEARAQPVALIYESPIQRGFHVPGLDLLEGEMTSWIPKESKDSPNRLDALVLVFDALGHIHGTRSAGSLARAERSNKPQQQSPQTRGVTPRRAPRRNRMAAMVARLNGRR